MVFLVAGGVSGTWKGVFGSRKRNIEKTYFWFPPGTTLSAACFWFPHRKYREKVFLVPAGDNTVGCTTCNVVTRQNARWSIRDVAVQRTGQLRYKTEKQKTRAVEIDGIGGFASLYAEIYGQVRNI